MITINQTHNYHQLPLIVNDAKRSCLQLFLVMEIDSY